MMNKNILIVEDDRVASTLLASILKKAGYDVVFADNGKNALKLMAGMKPDLIIADVLMPEMNGYEFYKQVKKKGDTSNIPFIILSSRKDIGEIFIEFDVDDFFSKPIDTEKLLERINILVTSGRKKSLNRLQAEAEMSKKASRRKFFIGVGGGAIFVGILLVWFVSSSWEEKKFGDDIEYVENQDLVDSFGK